MMYYLFNFIVTIHVSVGLFCLGSCCYLAEIISSLRTDGYLVDGVLRLKVLSLKHVHVGPILAKDLKNDSENRTFRRYQL